MSSQLIDRLRARAADSTRFNDMAMELHPRASLTSADLDALERRVGFAVPALLREVLTALGDGWGPGYGLLGSHVDQSGFPPELLGRKLLPLCDWGCAIFSVADCAAPDAPVYVVRGGAPHVLEDPATGYTLTSAEGEVLAHRDPSPAPLPRVGDIALTPHRPSLAAWLTAWADGVKLWDEMERLQREVSAGGAAAARRLQDAGDHSAAVLLLEQALDADSENGEARLLLARSLAATGRWHRMRSELQEALELAPQLRDEAGRDPAFAQLRADPFTLPLLAPDDPATAAVNLMYEGDFDEAVPILEREIARRPDEGALHYFLGTALGEVGEVERARAEDERTVALLPGFPDGYLNLGCSLERAGRHEEAMAAYERALAIEPEFDGAALNLAFLHRGRGDHARSIAVLSAALEHLPDNGFLRYKRAESHALAGDAAAAAADLATVIAADAGALGAARESEIFARLADTPELKAVLRPKRR